ncbi:hypothetical protein DFQ26_001330, partial [Actinomortierella ambigua]
MRRPTKTTRRLWRIARNGQQELTPGDSGAQYNIGLMYEHDCGVDMKEGDATEWFRKAAEQEYADAQRGLGALSFHGRGAEQDYHEASSWLLKATDQGDVKLRFNIAFMHEN